MAGTFSGSLMASPEQLSTGLISNASARSPQLDVRASPADDMHMVFGPDGRDVEWMAIPEEPEEEPEVKPSANVSRPSVR